jgi:hypothetical protein
MHFDAEELPLASFDLDLLDLVPYLYCPYRFLDLNFLPPRCLTLL